MPSKLKGKWNLSNLLDITSQVAFSRFEYAARDVKKSLIRIVKTLVYDGKNPGQGSRTVFTIQSTSFPQYWPYYTKYDKWGRVRTYQKKYSHQYQVIVKLDYLTLSTPVKLRTGSDKKWKFQVPEYMIKSKKNPYAPYLSVGDYNAQALGVNGDFFFAHSYNRAVEGCLYGRNYADKAPEKYPTVFLGKHEIAVIEVLMNRGYLSK
jgi:hypothetical protein